jgi:galactokinase/mevalonate kinase-like predicted kinase
MKQLEREVEIQIYRNNIKELQEQLQEAYKKIKKQGEIISNLEELLAL